MFWLDTAGKLLSPCTFMPLFTVKRVPKVLDASD